MFAGHFYSKNGLELIFPTADTVFIEETINLHSETNKFKNGRTSSKN
jgi:hypothetical protein